MRSRARVAATKSVRPVAASIAAIIASTAVRFDPHIVAAALLIGCRRTPVEQLLVAGRERLLPAVLHHVEIKANATALELGCVDGPYSCLDASPLQAAYEMRARAAPDRGSW